MQQGQQRQQQRRYSAQLKYSAPGLSEADHHLALNHQQLIDSLSRHPRLLTVEERHLFPQFAQLLSNAMHMRMLGVWQDLKTLYNPLDPDKDLRSLPTPSSGKDRQAIYERFMRTFTRLADKANFRPLTTGTCALFRCILSSDCLGCTEATSVLLV